MLYKYISETPFTCDKNIAITMGDTIAIYEDSIRNLTSGKDFSNIDQSVINYIINCSEEIQDIQEEELYELTDDKRIASIPIELYNELKRLGILDKDVRISNVGTSDYSKHIIQPWSIWKDYNLNPWDADIIKRVLRTKKESGKSEIESRIMDYEKIIHICKERIRQLKCNRNE